MSISAASPAEIGSAIWTLAGSLAEALDFTLKSKDHLGALCVTAASLAERAWAVMHRDTRPAAERPPPLWLLLAISAVFGAQKA